MERNSHNVTLLYRSTHPAAPPLGDCPPRTSLLPGRLSITPTPPPALSPFSLWPTASNMLQLQLGRERTEREATALRTQLLERDARCAHLDAEVTRGGGGKPLCCGLYCVMQNAPIWMQM